MSVTRTIKRLAGISGGEVGVESNREYTVHECTVCGERFDVERTICPNCESQISRTKTVVPYTLVNLFVVLVATGIHAIRNILTGNVPPE
ncbi:hypothetical protein GCM10008985_04970 [Halococcus dombrowskii]|uniref:Uncharacterized protein n=1 Tax=Halococcus dombrowskii TaxID=179637 RepID=A0AAV3SDI2_HALDO